MDRNLRIVTRAGLITVLALLLRADSCSTTDREIQTPVQFTLEYALDVSMNTAVADTVDATVDLSGPMLAALDARRSDTLPDSVYWVGMSATFTRNDGFDTTRDLALRVGEPGTAVELASSRVPIPDNRVGTTAIVSVFGGTPFEDVFQLDLNSQGLGASELYRIANEALEEFRTTGDITPRDVLLRSIWTNDRGPGDPADDFTLRVRLNFQMLDGGTVDVYHP